MRRDLPAVLERGKRRNMTFHRPRLVRLKRDPPAVRRKVRFVIRERRSIEHDRLSTASKRKRILDRSLVIEQEQAVARPIVEILPIVRGSKTTVSLLLPMVFGTGPACPFGSMRTRRHAHPETRRDRRSSFLSSRSRSTATFPSTRMSSRPVEPRRALASADPAVRARQRSTQVSVPRR